MAFYGILRVLVGTLADVFKGGRCTTASLEVMRLRRTGLLLAEELRSHRYLSVSL